MSRKTERNSNSLVQVLYCANIPLAGGIGLLLGGVFRLIYPIHPQGSYLTEYITIAFGILLILMSRASFGSWKLVDTSRVVNR